MTAVSTYRCEIMTRIWASGNILTSFPSSTLLGGIAIATMTLFGFASTRVSAAELASGSSLNRIKIYYFILYLCRECIWRFITIFTLFDFFDASFSARRLRLTSSAAFFAASFSSFLASALATALASFFAFLWRRFSSS